MGRYRLRPHLGRIKLIEIGGDNNSFTLTPHLGALEGEIDTGGVIPSEDADLATVPEVQEVLGIADGGITAPDRMQKFINKTISGEIIDNNIEVLHNTACFNDCDNITGIMLLACKSLHGTSLIANNAQLRKVILPALIMGFSAGDYGMTRNNFANNPNLALIFVSGTGGNADNYYAGGGLFNGQNFNGDTSLKSLILGDGFAAYRGVIYLNDSAAQTFSNTPIINGTGYVYIPDARLAEYQASTNWAAIAAQLVGYNDAPAYSSTATYSIGDVCKNGGYLYAWINNTDGNSEPTLATAKTHNSDWFCASAI